MGSFTVNINLVSFKSSLKLDVAFTIHQLLQAFDHTLYLTEPMRGPDNLCALSCAMPVHRPYCKVGEDMTEEEMSRYVMYAYHRTGWAFFMDVLSNPNKVEFGPNEVEPLTYDFVEPIPSGYSEEFWDICYRDTVTSPELWDNGASAPLAGRNMRETILEILPVYERMKEAMER